MDFFAGPESLTSGVDQLFQPGDGIVEAAIAQFPNSSAFQPIVASQLRGADFVASVRDGLLAPGAEAIAGKWSQTGGARFKAVEMNEVIDFAAEGGGDGEFASKNLDAYLAVGANTGSAAGELREKFVRIVAEVDRMAGADGAAARFVAQQIGGVVGNEGPSGARAGI